MLDFHPLNRILVKILIRIIDLFIPGELGVYLFVFYLFEAYPNDMDCFASSHYHDPGATFCVSR